MTEKDDRETEEYLARIRRTIAESSRLVEQAGLRIAETDRLLESQGLTREQVMGFQFTDAQREAVNRELERRGLNDWKLESLDEAPDLSRPASSPDLQPSDPPGFESSDLSERQRKFGMMMKPFQI